jgi:hypothetical protein
MFSIATRTARQMIDIDVRVWIVVDRFTTPREPAKPDDLVVLSILGTTCGLVVLGSLGLVAQHLFT